MCFMNRTCASILASLICVGNFSRSMGDDCPHTYAKYFAVRGCVPGASVANCPGPCTGTFCNFPIYCDVTTSDTGCITYLGPALVSYQAYAGHCDWNAHSECTCQNMLPTGPPTTGYEACWYATGDCRLMHLASAGVPARRL